jgi:hypothetical protein
MRHQPLSGGGGRGGGLPISATPFNTIPTPNSIWAAPGAYTVRLTAAGKTYTQPLTLRLDPRVKTPPAEIARVSEMSKALYDGAVNVQAALQQMRAIRAQVKPLLEKAGQAPVAKAIAEFDKKAGAIEGAAGGGMGQRGGGAPPAGGERGGAGAGDTLSSIGGSLTSHMSALQAADAAPTTQLARAIAVRRQALTALTAKWDAFKAVDVPALNIRLKAAGLPAVELK